MQGKIFCIGLDKTGTTSLHNALKILGFSSVHFMSEQGNIKDIIRTNYQKGKNLLTGIEHFDAYSDWNRASTNHLYKVLDKQYSGSKFILTTRNLDKWLISREKHVNRIPGLPYYQKLCPNDTWLNKDKESWTEEFKNHHQDILHYFKDRKEDLLIFNISQGDAWTKLCSFLSLPVPYRSFPFSGNSKKITPTFIKEDYRKHGNILLKDKKAIFFPIPKNACSSIKSRLIAFVILKKNINFSAGKLSVHDFPFPYTKRSLLNRDYKDYFKFALVRNPWARLVSCYKNKIQNVSPNFSINGISKIFHRYKGLFWKGMSFEAFVESICSIPDLDADKHFQSQLFQLTNDSCELLVNYIGRLERLDIAHQDIFENTGVSFLNLPCNNQSNKGKHYTDYYDEVLIEKVRNRYAADIEFFEYEFEFNPEKKTIRFVDEQTLTRLAEINLRFSILKEKNKGLIQQLRKIKQNLTNKLQKKVSNTRIFTFKNN